MEEVLQPLSDESNSLDNLGRPPNYTWTSPQAENPAVYSVEPVRSLTPAVFIAAAGGDEIARILELKFHQDDSEEFISTVDVVFEAKTHSDTIIKCCVNSDGSLLATAGMDGKVSLFEIVSTKGGENQFPKVTANHIQDFEGPTLEIEDFVWSPKGNVFMAVSADATAWLWHASRGFVGVLTGHAGKVTKCALKAIRDVNGKEEILAVTGSVDGSVIIWDPLTAQARFKADVCSVSSHASNEEIDGIISMACHPTEPIVAVGCADGSLAVVNLLNGAIVNKVLDLVVGFIECVAFAPSLMKQHLSEDLLAVGDSSGVVKVLNASTLETRHSLTHSQAAETCTVTQIAWTQDWPCSLISAGNDGFIRVWDARNGQLLDILFGADDSILDLKIFRVGENENLVIAGTEEGSVSMWELL